MTNEQWLAMKIPLIGKVDKPPRWLVGLVLTTLIGSGGYFAYTQFVNKQPTQRQRGLTVEVKTQDLAVKISASGTAIPIKEVYLSPTRSGRIAQLLVEQGDKVQQGQIIARMEDSEIQAQIAQAAANVDQAEARLALAIAGSRPTEIAQARSRLAQAEAKLAEAKAGSRPEEISQAQSQVNAAQAQLNLTKERTTRYQQLAQSGAIAQDQLDEVLTNERNAQANLQQAQKKVDLLRNGTRQEQIIQAEAAVAEARQALQQLLNGTRPEEIAQNTALVAQAKAQLKAVQVQQSDTIITAPFSGTITQKYANVGAFVTPTTSASSTSSATSSSIVAIANNLEVLAKVPERDIGQIRLNQTVEVKADAFPGEKFRGKVRLIAPAAVVEQNVTSFQVRISLETGQNKLRSGMNLDLTFLGESIKDAVVVPTVAIITQKGKTGVMVPDANQQPQFQPVTLGFSLGEQTQILEGLEPGDQVFVYVQRSPRSRSGGSGGSGGRGGASGGGLPVRFR